MKNFLTPTIVTISLLLLSHINLSAQDFVAGPKTGISFTQVDGDSYAGFNKIGFNLGGFVYRRLSKRWDVQFEIEYLQKGSKKTPDVEKGDYNDYQMNLGYIQFPVLARYKIKKFSLEGGLSIGALIHEQEWVEGAEIPEDKKVSFQTMEYATIFGFNYNITDRLWVNARYSYSINRIRIPYDGDIPIYNPHWDKRKPGQYNDIIVVSVYYALNKLL